jgi:hypothetical protein
MDAVEQWLRDRSNDVKGDSANMPRTWRDVCMGLADEWLDNPGMVTVQYDTPSPMADFLDQIDGPAMIGLDPVIYPACTRCSQAWKLTRARGVWSWSPDCTHKTASCKLVHA